MVQSIVTSGDYRFQADADWAQWPAGWDVLEVSAVATDSRDRVYVFNRSDQPVAVIDPDGKFMFSWGEPGAGPCKFHVPHGIAVDREGTVIVADRENSRLQFFSPTGAFLREWTDIARPCDLEFDAAGNIYVAELGYRTGMWSGTH